MGRHRKSERRSQKASKSQRSGQKLLRREERMSGQSTHHGGGGGPKAGSTRDWRRAIQQDTLRKLEHGAVMPTAQLRNMVAACRLVDMQPAVTHLMNGGKPRRSKRRRGSAAEYDYESKEYAYSGPGAKEADGRCEAAPIALPDPQWQELQVEVTTEDCGDAAVRLVEELGDASSVCLLNMASDRNPGGGYKNGAGAQEEYLCRVSSMAPCVEGMRDLYRIPELSAIHVPQLTIFRHCEADRYKLRDKPTTVACVCFPAVRCPSTTTIAHPPHSKDNPSEKPVDEWWLDSTSEARVRAKIVALLWLCAAKGHTDLVLGAWGCGAYRNPPRHVAKVFASCLRHKVFAGRFRRVIFPVLDGTRWHNFKPFARTLHHLQPKHAAPAGAHLPSPPTKRRGGSPPGGGEGGQSRERSGERSGEGSGESSGESSGEASSPRVDRESKVEAGPDDESSGEAAAATSSPRGQRGGGEEDGKVNKKRRRRRSSGDRG